MNKLLSILKNIGIVTGALATIGGVFWYLDGIQDGVQSLQQEVEYVNAEQSMMAEDMQSIQDSLDKIRHHQGEQDEYMARMEGAAKFYIRNQKQMTEETMQDALEVILKKNMSPTSANRPEWIPYDWKECETFTEAENTTYNSIQ